MQNVELHSPASLPSSEAVIDVKVWIFLLKPAPFHFLITNKMRNLCSWSFYHGSTAGGLIEGTAWFTPSPLTALYSVITKVVLDRAPETAVRIVSANAAWPPHSFVVEGKAAVGWILQHKRFPLLRFGIFELGLCVFCCTCWWKLISSCNLPLLFLHLLFPYKRFNWFLKAERVTSRSLSHSFSSLNLEIWLLLFVLLLHFSP